jgi:Coenzyme PQQ synthesis protein D (PqqD)
MRRFRIKNPQVIHETVDEEVVVVNLETGNYYSLVGSGQRIWAAVEREESVSEVVAGIHAAYEASEHQLEETVQAFLDTLEGEGLIVSWEASGPTATEDPPAPTRRREPFMAPRLERFTDMQELILLDPVHEIEESAGWPHPKDAG